MNCLVVAATIHEIDPFLKQYRIENGLPAGVETDILVSGVGLTATTYSLARQLRIKRPDIIIQAGIAGCFDTTIPLGTVLVVKQEAIADQGVIETAKLKTIFDLQLAAPDQYPFSKGWLVNKTGLLKKVKLKKVKAVSVNNITVSKQSVKLYRAAFDPVIESMEGAALHYVCLMEKIPFLQLRAVSNYIGERNKKNWQLKESITNLNKELIRLLNNL